MSESRHKIEILIRDVNQLLQNKSFMPNLYHSLNGIAFIINAILKTNGDDWAKHVVDSYGEPVFSLEDQVKYTKAFEPYVPSILIFFGKSTKGGAGEMEPGSDAASIANNVEPGTNAKNAATNAKNAAKHQRIFDTTPVKMCGLFLFFSGRSVFCFFCFLVLRCIFVPYFLFLGWSYHDAQRNEE